MNSAFRFNSDKLRRGHCFPVIMKTCPACTASSGTGCDIGDAFNGDAATVKGLELLVSTDLAAATSYSVPFMLTHNLITVNLIPISPTPSSLRCERAGDPIPIS